AELFALWGAGTQPDEIRLVVFILLERGELVAIHQHRAAHRGFGPGAVRHAVEAHQELLGRLPHAEDPVRTHLSLAAPQHELLGLEQRGGGRIEGADAELALETVGTRDIADFAWG